MSISFGVGTLSVLRNLLLTGGVITTGSSGAAASNAQISSGLIMIDGITATLSGQSASYSILTGTINTGSGLLVYAYIDTNSTTTATAGIASAADPINTASNVPTAICPLARFSFGTGALSISTIVAWSGGSATRTIGKVQNVKLNLSYEQHQMRGGGDLFPTDTQFANGAVEGSFEFTDQTATQFYDFFGGIYASAGAAGSGTWTLSGNSKPESMSLLFQNVTNGITSVFSLMRAYVTQGSNDFGRTDYMNPTYNFVGQANIKGTVVTVQG